MRALCDAIVEHVSPVDGQSAHRFAGAEFWPSLLERHAAGVRLTAAGEVFAQQAHTTMRDFDRRRSEIDDLQQLRRGMATRISYCAVRETSYYRLHAEYLDPVAAKLWPRSHVTTATSPSLSSRSRTTTFLRSCRFGIRLSDPRARVSCEAEPARSRRAPGRAPRGPLIIAAKSNRGRNRTLSPRNTRAHRATH
jgi:DNA-binding transcriptional LysR family regulator